MQNVKKSLSIKVLASFTLLFLLVSIFANFIERRDKIQNVAAVGSDTISPYYDYKGASTFSITSFISLDSIWRESLTIDVRFDLYTSSLGTRVGGDFYYYLKTDSEPFISKHKLLLFSSSGLELTLNNLFTSNYSEILYLSTSANELLTYGGFPMAVMNVGNFTGNIKYIELGECSDFKQLNYGSSFLKPFFIKFFETENDYFYFEFAIPTIVEYEPRIYYIKNPSEFTEDEKYEFGYNTGYSDGYSSGSSDGNSQGYKSGYDFGIIEGYNNGYSKGVENAGKYTFTNLLGAVIDVPVKTFTNLFNFELLGVNLASFFSGLLTLAVIITIIKLLL